MDPNQDTTQVPQGQLDPAQTSGDTGAVTESVVPVNPVVEPAAGSGAAIFPNPVESVSGAPAAVPTETAPAAENTDVPIPDEAKQTSQTGEGQ